MRRVRYVVGASLDGYIADADDGLGWMTAPEEAPGDFLSAFDTAVMGRRTFEVAFGGGGFPGLSTHVFSRTLAPDALPGVTVSPDDPARVVSALREQPGRDIWLVGGGVLFRTLLQAGLVDTVEVGVQPVLLGGGVPLLPPGNASARLELEECRAFGGGPVLLRYAVRRDGAAPHP